MTIDTESYPNKLSDKTTSTDVSTCCRSVVGTCLFELTPKYNEVQ